jgi:type IV pilus assembly protein PilC
MPQFAYEARDARGASTSGTIEASDQQSALNSLVSRGLMVIALRAESVKAKTTVSKSGRVKADDLVMFTRQLATMVDAGLPLVQALSSLEEQAANKVFKVIIKDIRERVEGGSSFSEALSKHPRVFNRLYVSMVQAGEIGGLLAEILDRIASYLESTHRLRKKVISSMTYPAAVSVIAFVIVAFLMFFIVPKFGEIYDDLGSDLPTPTKILVGISNAVVSNAPWVVLGLIAVIIGFFYWKKTPPGAYMWDKLKLKFPVFGPLLHKVSLSRFCRTFASLIRSGVPILDALQIVATSSGNRVVEKCTVESGVGVEKGENLSLALSRYEVFPPMMLRMIAAGEQTGNVDLMLEKLADFYDTEVDATLQSLTSLIEPLLIVFLGVVVGGIVICMFLPIFGLSQAVAK